MKNFFSINKLKNIVFLGISSNINELVKICKKNKINSEIICTPLQLKELNFKSKIKTFKKLNQSFKTYITKKYNINETLFIAHGSRWIFSKDIIENLFLNQIINFHGTRLPYDRGGAGVSWKILRNDRLDNLCVYKVDAGIDTGPVLMNKTYIIPEKYQIPEELMNFTKERYNQFFEDFIKKIIQKKVIRMNGQPKYLGRYNPRLNTQTNGWINWELSSDDIVKFIKAFDNPFDGARTFLGNKKVIIKKVQLHGGDSSNHPFMSGLVSRHDKDWLVVSSRDKNMILIEQVTDFKGNNYLDFIKEGDRFSTPRKYLDNSYKRVKYSINGLV